MSPTFRSLRLPNYRRYALGALASNVGTWMHRIAAAWLIYSLTGDAVMLGVVTALQFAPMLVLGPWAGSLADRFDRRTMLAITQMLLAVQALMLGIVVLAGAATVPMVLFASAALGVVSAFDAPARQAFVSDLVGPEDLPNAVGLNSASFHAARLIGPAVAGLMIAAVGTGWVFIANAATFLFMLLALWRISTGPLPVADKQESGIREGFRYLRRHPDLMMVVALVGVIATFGLNFQVTIAVVSTQAFDGDAEQYGVLSSVMAIGSVAGALWAARRTSSPLGLVFAAAGVFSLTTVLSGLAPTRGLFGLALVLTGAAGLTMMTAATSYLQTHTDKAHRGRVLAIYMAVFFGTTPVGAPVVGWLAEGFGARTSLWLPGLLGLLVTTTGWWWWHRRATTAPTDAPGRVAVTTPAAAPEGSGPLLDHDHGPVLDRDHARPTPTT